MRKTTTSDRLHYLMNTRGLKQVDILRETKPFQKKYNINLSKSTLSQYVNNIQSPDQDRLYLLAKTLNVSEPWLMGFDVPMERSDPDIDNNNHIKKVISDKNKPNIRLAELRKKTKKSQAELSEILGISYDTLNMYETGQEEPDLDTLTKISDLFNVTTDFLLGRSAQTTKEDINNEFNLLLDDISAHIKHLTQADKEMIHSLARAYLQNKEKACADFE